jgi:UDP-N-acetylmuramoyl-L-alanyl-D-glutamate--2,6-diaminopimelate ligase
VERPLELGVPELVVADARAATATAAAEVLGRPAERLRIVGVTGTNGKTTVVSLVGAVLDHAGLGVRVLGTLTGERTTPEAPDLQSRLAEFADAGVTHVAMEVSSHALALHRVDAVPFAVGAFTNLGTDHLDFHGTREAYFAAKASLFDPGRCAHAVADVDDVHGRLLVDASGGAVEAVSLDDAGGLELRPDGSSFTWRGHRVELPLPGRHNVSNALVAAACCRALEVPDDVVAAGLGTVAAVPGRYQRVPVDAPFTVVVDYAHTPDALEHVLAATRELLPPGGRSLVVFGCGGDRDTGKRPLMGEVACRLADLAVLTTDNPRSEDPLAIIDEVRAGCRTGAALVVEPDRRSAIRAAVAAARPGDVVVVAGKGHEQGQHFADRVEPFDDVSVAADEVRALLGAAPGAPT